MDRLVELHGGFTVDVRYSRVRMVIATVQKAMQATPHRSHAETANALALALGMVQSSS
jgi:hypothetical protein